MVCLYALTPFVIIRCHFFISNAQTVIYFLEAPTAIIFLIIKTVFVCIDFDSSDLYFFIISDTAIIAIVAVFLKQFFIIHYAKILDSLFEQPDLFRETVKSQNSAVNTACVGFSIGHPHVISWKFLRSASDKWPKCDEIWMIFARFVAVFPHESRLLMWIDDQIALSLKMTPLVQFFRSQIRDVVQRREASMTPGLKKKIVDFQKLSSISRNRLREFWECVLQGDVTNISISGISSMYSIRDTERVMMEVLETYPNNSHCVRCYCHFVQSLLCNKEKMQLWTANYRKLKTGQCIHPDPLYDSAVDLFPLIKSSAMPAVGQDQQEESNNFITENFEIAPTQQDNTKIDFKVILPFTRISIILIVVSLAVFFFIAIPAILWWIHSRKDNILLHLNNTASLAELRNMICHMVLLGTFHISSALDVTIPEKVNLSPYGNAHNFTEAFKYQIKTVQSQIDLIRYYASENNVMDERAMTILYSPCITVEDFVYTNGSVVSNYRNVSVETISSFIASTMIRLITKTNIDDISQVWDRSDMVSVYSMLWKLCDSIDELCDIFSKQASDDVTNTKKMIMIISISFICFCVAVWVAFIASMVHMMDVDIHAAINCFLKVPHYLVENVIDSYVQRLKAATAVAKQQLTQNTSEDENTILTLSASNSRSYSVEKLKYTFVISLLFMLLACIGSVLVIWLLFRNVINPIEEATPQVNLFMGAYSYLIQAIIRMEISSLFQEGYPLPAGPDLAGHKDAITQAIGYSQSVFIESIFSETLGVTSIFQIDTPISQLFFTPHPYGNLDLTAIDVFVYIQIIAKEATFAEKMNDNALQVWDAVAEHLYNRVYSVCSESFINGIEADSKSTFTTIIWLIVVFFIIMIIALSVAIYSIVEFSNVVNWIIQQLGRLPTRTILESEPIMRVISGKFLESPDTGPELSNTFYSDIVRHTKSFTLIMTMDYKVTDVLSSGDTVLGYSKDTFIGKYLGTILDTIDAGDDSTQQFFKTLESIMLGHKKIDTRPIVQLKKADESVTYQAVTITPFTSKGATTNVIEMKKKLTSLGMHFCDCTKEMELSIELEKQNQSMQALLLSVLPSEIVPMMRNNDDVAYTILSASVAFIQFKDYNQYLQQNPTKDSMNHFRNMFSIIDGLMVTYPIVTRVKTFGDMYMLGAGLFIENCNAARHAKDCLSFLVDSVNMLIKYTKDHSLGTHVRVGMNSGGPVVAGIVRAKSPVFMLFGQTVVIAENLNEDGADSMIRITRSAYDAIYSGSFKINEYKPFEMRNICIDTFLVDPNGSQ